MKKVALYVRVSTQEQANEGYSIDAQKERLINYCKSFDYNIVKIYVDAGFSDSNLERLIPKDTEKPVFYKDCN